MYTKDMQSDNKQFFVLLISIWLVFIIWEIDIQMLPVSIQTSMVRFDLLVLPVLLLVTGYAIYNILKNKNQKNML